MNSWHDHSVLAKFLSVLHIYFGRDAFYCMLLSLPYLNSPVATVLFGIMVYHCHVSSDFCSVNLQSFFFLSTYKCLVR